MIKIIRRHLLGSILGTGLSYRISSNAQPAAKDLHKPIGDHSIFSPIESGSGPIVVLVHGAVADPKFWEPLTQQLTDRYTVIAYSLRGHFSRNQRDALPAKGTPDNKTYSLDQHADDLADLLRSLISSPVHLIGHDIGANIALLAAIRHKRLAASLTLANPSELGFNFHNHEFREAVAIDRQAIDAISRDLAGVKPARALEFFLKRYVGAETHGVPEWATAMYQQNAACLPKLVGMYPTETCFNDAALDKVEVPVNLISGSFGRWSSRTINDLLADGFSKAPHILLPGGHLAPVHHPREFAQAVRVFLERIGTNRSARRT